MLAVNQTFVPDIGHRQSGGVNNCNKTDAAGDIAEYDSASCTCVSVPVAGDGQCRRAVDGQLHRPRSAVLARPAAGTTIANVATLAYVARTLNKPPSTFTGNVVNTQVAALADRAADEVVVADIGQRR